MSPVPPQCPGCTCPLLFKSTGRLSYSHPTLEHPPCMKTKEARANETYTVSLATLFYISKRRQWRLAETLRRSVKRVGTGLSRVMTPRTPHKMTFSPMLSSSEKQRNKHRNGSSTVLIDERDRLQSPDRSGNVHGNGRKERGGERTAEKGLSTVNEENRNSSPSSQRSSSQDAQSGRKSKRPPPPPPVTVPQSKFEMDSPKTPLWSKVFGR